MKRSALAVLAAASLLVACASAPPHFSHNAPLNTEAASGYTEKPGWTTKKYAVAAADPLATDAGYQMLKAGGSAVDAAVAVQMVLTLVEPNASGIGGGSFLLHFNGKDVEAFDGRETAPAAADERLFLNPDGKALAYFEAAVGGRAVGVPGTVRVLEMAHKQYGKLPWAQLLQPAIQLAENGFKVYPRLNSLAKADAGLKDDPAAAAYYFKRNGEVVDVGYNLRNPELAAVLKRIAAEGSKAFYEGDVAQAIVNKVQGHPTNPGKMALADLEGYQPIKRTPICFDYTAQAKEYRLCGFPPPSSGAIAIGQVLGILINTNAARLPLENGLPSAEWLHYYTEASRLAYADRDQYIADAEFVEAPAGGWTSLLEPTYLAQRAELIGLQSMKTAQPGQPDGVTSIYAPMRDQAEHGASHISIVDGYGNAIAMTTTIENSFGSRQMVMGFMLNSQLTDFSLAPTDAKGKPVANRVQPGKRPRSSMSPMLVFDKASGELVFTGGSSGGALIIHYATKTLYGVLNWGMTPQQAVSLPNFASLNGPSILEEKRFPRTTVEALRARGAEVREKALVSGLQAITRRMVNGEMVWLGGTDPRHDGIVLGD